MMNSLRFTLAAAVLGFASLVPLTAMAADPADTYPNRPIRLLVGTNPGASVDASARIISEGLTKLLGQPVVVENQPGAGGTLAIKNVIAAKPDGYTLVYYYLDSVTIAPLLAKDPPFDPIRDVEHLGSVVRTGGLILAVPGTSPVKTFDEFIKLAKASPRKLNYGSWGIGSSPHLGFEALGPRLGMQMVHVPYKSGGASFAAAVAGEIDIVTGAGFFQLVNSGKLRALAVGGTARYTEMPNVPTLAELGYGDQLFAPVFYGIAGPKGTPRAVMNKVREALQTWLRTPENTERLKAIGLVTAINTPEEVTASIKRTTDEYAPIIKRLGLSNQ